MRKKTPQADAALDPESFKARLKEAGLKATPQRVAVHDAMLSLVHASADMVAGRIAATGGARITVSSVYNILSGMADLGIYARRFSPENKMWFDVNACTHIHAYDCVNGTFMDIMDGDLVKSMEDKLKKTRIKGYRTERPDILLLCRPSRKTLKKK